MRTNYPVTIVADDGVTELTGRANFTDASDAPADGAFFKGWTSDNANPANVNGQGATITGVSIYGDLLTGFLGTPGFTGALPTITFVSGTGRVVDAGASSPVYVPVTYDASTTDATVKIELSPDGGATYSTLATKTWKHFTGAVAGNVDMLALWVPLGWMVKLTAVNAVLGTATQLFSSTA